MHKRGSPFQMTLSDVITSKQWGWGLCFYVTISWLEIKPHSLSKGFEAKRNETGMRNRQA